VDCAYGVGLPPPELRIGWQCERWSCLPEAGAYLDQDCAFMYRMTGAMNVYGVLMRWQGANTRTIHSLSDSDRKILRHLKDMGLMFN